MKIAKTAIKIGDIIMTHKDPRQPHAEIFLSAAVDLGYDKDIHDDCYGFVTDCGKFVTRSQAAHIACEAGQISARPQKLYSYHLFKLTQDT